MCPERVVTEAKPSKHQWPCFVTEPDERQRELDLHQFNVTREPRLFDGALLRPPRPGGAGNAHGVTSLLCVVRDYQARQFEGEKLA